MKYLFAFWLSFVVFNSFAIKLKWSESDSAGGGINLLMKTSSQDSLPLVFPENHADIVGSLLKNEAYCRFMEYDLPTSISEFEKFKDRLKNDIIIKAGITIDHTLPLDLQETGSKKMDGFTIKNIYFQTLPGVYATANLYIPDGDGPFAAVINLHGHWQEARLCEQMQAVAQTLAINGYVVLCIDAFGAGERSTFHGKSEYHGANLGLSLINIGKSLLGTQVSENIRGVDLLCSLPYVNAEKIGATGASGGGNQTMWLSAFDERIRAVVPVVSVGSFETYIMENNCVCELLIDGLTMTEESGILALIAPRSVLMINHNKESNPSFYPSEMLRTYTNAKPVFKMLGVEKNLSYQLFDLVHDYLPEDRAAMLAWFNQHLKGIGKMSSSKEFVFENIPYEQLMVFPHSKRDPKVKTIQEYCKLNGEEFKSNLLASNTIDVELKRAELKKILRISVEPAIKSIHMYPDKSGWKRYSLESNDGQLIPLLLIAPSDKSQGFTIMCDPKGKDGISLIRINELKSKGAGIVIVDLFGIGEASSPKANSFDKRLAQFHTLSRAELWMGKTVLGEWVCDLDLVVKFLKGKYNADKISIDANRETGLASLYFSAIKREKFESITLHEAPVSYLFDSCDGINFFSMGIHLPQFLVWGDVSLAAALSGKKIQFINPVSMSGNIISQERQQAVSAEFEQIRKLCHQTCKTVFNRITNISSNEYH